MFRYFAGNHHKHAIQIGQQYLGQKKQFPIINFAIESTGSSEFVKNEYTQLISQLPSMDYSVAMKLSSVNFSKNMMTDLVEQSARKGISVYIDAEDEPNNERYQEVSTDFMSSYANVYKTYQMYRKDALDTLCKDIHLCANKNMCINAKLVRGAYWNTESPDGHLFTEKSDTDDSYNRGIMALYNVKSKMKPKVLLATHNDTSANLGRILNTQNRIFEFAHLQGMREKYYQTISDKEQVHVYIPYGPYREMIPYLTRRMYENVDMIRYM